MHDPRTSNALRHLAELTGDPPPPRWEWVVARLDGAGRIPLPRHARTALSLPEGASGDVRARLHRSGLMLSASSGSGRLLAVDRRGRLAVPAALRTADGMVIGTRTADALVVLAPSTVLDGLGEVLAGRRA